MSFALHSEYGLAGDQRQAVDFLARGFKNKSRDQVLVGVTGSGKTFTIANVIEKLGMPTLIMTHNKTLASQIFSEMKAFFPDNAVEYFVSYYDYYQPEAYVPNSDTYIEKTSAINEEIDRMRHSATRSLLERRDVIIVASVSCIYGIGPIETYADIVIKLGVGDRRSPQKLCRQLADLQYQRNDIDFKRGTFRSKGDVIEIFPSHKSDCFWKLSFFGDEIETISEVEYPSYHKLRDMSSIKIFSNSHYTTSTTIINRAIKQIQGDLLIRLQELERDGKLLEKQRLEQRVMFDMEMLKATGMCSGIENYSRYLTGRQPGEPPPTLLEYLPVGALLVVDESHVSIPQVRGMYLGDRARKQTLSDYGFRLPSCMDNRPLKFEEWDFIRPQTIFMSATPSAFELSRAGEDHVVEQLVRPTGILDPICIVRPCDGQVDDLIAEIQATTRNGFRTLITTLTKKMAEHLTEYLAEYGINVTYMHSDTDTLDRIEIMRALKAGEFDVLVGINLLREGLDIPECALVAILDADKEGYLRSRTALVQTIGRAARNPDGRVIMYADVVTGSMRTAMEETERRRSIQHEFNIKHNIQPKPITKRPMTTPTAIAAGSDGIIPATATSARRKIAELEKQMLKASENLLFEEAAMYRDELQKLLHNTSADDTDTNSKKLKKYRHSRGSSR
ncbi:MAG: excinuclease ABC subunit UvrB [Holosporales bacterium]|jgi:excinuclease ABC subunit B|nr:excinuclease ABC subunit UvrB [Holosporales bacterium]